MEDRILADACADCSPQASPCGHQHPSTRTDPATLRTAAQNLAGPVAWNATHGRGRAADVSSTASPGTSTKWPPGNKSATCAWQCFRGR